MLNNTIAPRDFFALMDQMFRPVSEETPRPTTLALPIDVFEKNDALNVRALMPGIAPENVEINVEDNVLTISGESHFAHEEKDAKIFRRENAYGTFRRSVRLSEEFDATKAQATFAHGVVTVMIPRAEQAKPKVLRIPVSTLAQDATPVAGGRGSDGTVSHEQENQG
jgi:HSP20 family protein